MTPKNAPPAPSDPEERPRPSVKLQKPSAGEATVREKLCAECGRAFEIGPDQKFYLCPSCYRRKFGRRTSRPGTAQVLVQITCISCGAQEYLDRMPADPAKALCRTCFAEKRREPQPPSPHSTHTEE